jgi:hypothetical protein
MLGTYFSLELFHTCKDQLVIFDCLFTLYKNFLEILGYHVNLELLVLPNYSFIILIALTKCLPCSTQTRFC